MSADLPHIADVLAHVHLSDTNRDVLGTEHWDTATFLRDLQQAGYNGWCSLGVYNTRRLRGDCITGCMQPVRTVQRAG